MEERVPPPPDEPPPEPGPALRSGKYLVQVPKDQIYRVPPPENALIVESHLNLANRKNSSSFFSRLLIFIAVLLFVAILGVVILFFDLKPNSPTFSIEHLVVKNMNYHHNRKSFLKYDFMLKTKNPNGMIGFTYDRGGSLSLLFKQQKIATGDSPVLDQSTKEAKDFRVVLAGSNAVLPREVQKKVKDRTSLIPLVLSLNVPVKMKMGGMKAWGTNMDILCNLKVNTLGKDTRILFQECCVMT